MKEKVTVPRRGYRLAPAAILILLILHAVLAGCGAGTSSDASLTDSATTSSAASSADSVATSSAASPADSATTSSAASSADSAAQKYGTRTDYVGSLERLYTNQALSISGNTLVWPWEYRTKDERFTTLLFDGRSYSIRSSAYFRGIGEPLLGDTLGEAALSGFDESTEKTYTENAEIRRIRSVDPAFCLAARLPSGTFYVYAAEEFPAPQTLGDFMEAAGLPETMPLTAYYTTSGGFERERYTLSGDREVWFLLSEASASPLIPEDPQDPESSMRVSLSDGITFGATSEALGIYLLAMRITDTGYLWTNMTGPALVYEIGVSTARAVIDAAGKAGTRSQDVPYSSSLVGTLTEFSDTQILIDDTFLCADPADGMVFTVDLKENPRIRRCVEYGKMKKGDLVYLQFYGDIDKDNGNSVGGAYFLTSSVRALPYEGGQSVAE